MLRIVCRGDQHAPRDLTISLRFEGAFDAAFREGQSAGLMPGEALKNLVYDAARRHGTEEVEQLALAVSRELLDRQPRISRVRIEVAERSWERLEAGGRPQAQAFVEGGPEQRVALVTNNGKQVSVVGGIDDLTVMRSAGFAPAGRETADDAGFMDGRQRLLVGSLSARWTYISGDVTFRVHRQGVRAAIIDTLAWHQSQSVHHALYAIGEVVLSTYEEIADVRLAFHERPYRPADLFALGAENPDELFVVVDEPLGVVEVTLERC